MCNISECVYECVCVCISLIQIVSSSNKKIISANFVVFTFSFTCTMFELLSIAAETSHHRVGNSCILKAQMFLLCRLSRSPPLFLSIKNSFEISVDDHHHFSGFTVNRTSNYWQLAIPLMSVLYSFIYDVIKRIKSFWRPRNLSISIYNNLKILLCKQSVHNNNKNESIQSLRTTKIVLRKRFGYKIDYNLAIDYNFVRFWHVNWIFTKFATCTKQRDQTRNRMRTNEWSHTKVKWN